MNDFISRTALITSQLLWFISHDLSICVSLNQEACNFHDILWLSWLMFLSFLLSTSRFCCMVIWDTLEFQCLTWQVITPFCPMVVNSCTWMCTELSCFNYVGRFPTIWGQSSHLGSGLCGIFVCSYLSAYPVCLPQKHFKVIPHQYFSLLFVHHRIETRSFNEVFVNLHWLYRISRTLWYNGKCRLSISLPFLKEPILVSLA